MEEGILWRTDVMEGPCAVARGEDTNKHFINIKVFAKCAAES
jgi:hypothetical protein